MHDSIDTQGVAPNAAHLALARIEAASIARGKEFMLVTQNVDGLHHAAGSRRIHELHGNIRRVKCFERGHPAASWDESGETPPRCCACGSLRRPDVDCDVFLSVGTSGLVEPAASLAFAARDAGAAVIEVNPGRTPLTSRATIALGGSAATVLPLLS